MVTELGYLPAEQETAIPRAMVPALEAATMVSLAGLCRNAHHQGDPASPFSLRTLIAWGENQILLDDLAESFRLAFLNRCDDSERPLVAESYQRCLAQELRA